MFNLIIMLTFNLAILIVLIVDRKNLKRNLISLLWFSPTLILMHTGYILAYFGHTSGSTIVSYGVLVGLITLGLNKNGKIDVTKLGKGEK